MAKEKLISVETVREHSRAEDCWLVVDGKVWDFTDFLPEHPGGPSIILRYAGRDATQPYNEIHSPSLISDSLSQSKLIGTLDASTITSDWLKLPPKSTPELQLDQKPPLHTLISSHDLEEVASRTISKKAWAFYSSAATDCITHRANCETFDRIWWRPRVLRNVQSACTKTRILGVESSVPFFCAPAAMARLVDGEGEKGIARACAKAGVLQCISTNASFPASEICASVPSHPFFFQLYVNKDRTQTDRLLKSLPSTIRAIFVTVDAPIAGKREADERVRADESLSTPMSGAKAKNDKKGGALGRIMGGYIDPGLCWEDMKWLRSITSLPIVVKGIMSVEDAVMCAEAGIDGIVISNHGGRNLDGAPPSLRTLLQLRLARPEIFRKMEVYLDGGIRRGTDVLKAVCLGATAVGIGRPILYALNYGEEGVSHFIEIIRDELEVAMKLVGITNLGQTSLECLDLGEVETGLGLERWGVKSRL
ncbi:glycolate oxidase [Zopfia rhizophila CBS 207.26]|uniref:L-lactate dehydrogenase (cytochrome) n=1 Tax=Zopfia rhizophila CBS 207.26 TaxID=1314779 RepID=A0A6A6DZW2_9PEZI|nr:glycolate oxidase [Zopfia rhizophila CBS 207.26]